MSIIPINSNVAGPSIPRPIIYKSPSISKPPLEIIFHILSYLPTKDIPSVSYVSHYYSASTQSFIRDFFLLMKIEEVAKQIENVPPVVTITDPFQKVDDLIQFAKSKSIEEPLRALNALHLAKTLTKSLPDAGMQDPYFFQIVEIEVGLDLDSANVTIRAMGKSSSTSYLEDKAQFLAIEKEAPFHLDCAKKRWGLIKTPEWQDRSLVEILKGELLVDAEAAKKIPDQISDLYYKAIACLEIIEVEWNHKSYEPSEILESVIKLTQNIVDPRNQCFIYLEIFQLAQDYGHPDFAMKMLLEAKNSAQKIEDLTMKMLTFFEIWKLESNFGLEKSACMTRKLIKKLAKNASIEHSGKVLYKTAVFKTKSATKNLKMPVKEIKDPYWKTLALLQNSKIHAKKKKVKAAKKFLNQAKKQISTITDVTGKQRASIKAIKREATINFKSVAHSVYKIQNLRLKYFALIELRKVQEKIIKS